MSRTFPVLVALLLGIASSATSARLQPGASAVLPGTPRSPGGGATESAHVAPTAINAQGRVVGTYTWYPEADFDGPENRWAFVWSRERGFTVIAQNAEALDINDVGQVVGQYWACQPPMPEEGSPCERARGFLWSAARGFVDLGALIPAAINNAGRIAGYCSDVRVSCLRTGTSIRRLPAAFIADDLNERGVVSGIVRRPIADGSIVFRPAVWMASTGVRELSSSLPRGRVHAINESGTLVGTGDDGSVDMAMAWSPIGGVVVPAAEGSTAIGISDRAWIVGIAGSRPALWRVGERLTRLLIPGTPDARGAAIDANDDGEVIGAYETEHGLRAVLWIVTR
jgi:hypothetical protein